MSDMAISIAKSTALISAVFDGHVVKDEEAFEALNNLFIDSICTYIAAETKKQKTDIIKNYRNFFTAYVKAGYPLNLCSSDLPIDPDKGLYLTNISIISSKYLRQSPIWFASLCFIEFSLLGVCSLQKRNKDLCDLFALMDGFQLSFKILQKKSAPITGDRSLSGLACMAGLWATGAWAAKRDPFLRTTEVSIFYSCIESSAVAKKIEIALEAMNQIYELDRDVDRASSMNGLTALMRAAAYTSIPICTWLLERGANINQPDAATHATPIMHALDRKFGLGDFSNRKRIKETLDFLIAQGADITMKPLTGEDFGKLIINCLSLKGEDRKYYKEFWKNYKKSLPTSSTTDISNSTLVYSDVLHNDLKALDNKTCFLETGSYSELLIRVISFLVFEKNILQFTLQDMVLLLSGMEKRICVADTSRRNIEMKLNKLVAGAKRGINLTRNPKTGIFIVLSDSREPNVVSVS